MLIAPLVVDWELPFNAHFRQEVVGEELDRECDLVESYGISARQIVRARPGEIGRAVADVARDTHASLIVIGKLTSTCCLPPLLTGCVVGSPRRAVPRDDRHATGRVKDATLQGLPARSWKRAVVGRPMARRSRGDTPLEDSGAADLRLGFAVVGRLRDRVGDRRPHRGLGGSVTSFSRSPSASRLSWRSSSSRMDRPFRVYETSGGAYVVAKENLGPCRASSEPPPCRGLRTDGRCVDRRRGLRSDVVRAVSQRLTRSRCRSPVSRSSSFVNLSGVRESPGLTFALPTYGFVAAISALVGVGLAENHSRRRTAGGRPRPCGGRRPEG